MKYLNNYIDDAISEALDSAGAFFCFSKKQFDEEKQEGIKYISLGAGLLCPSKISNELLKKIENIHEEGIKRDLKENKRRGVVIRELDNHEAFYTGDISSTVKALEPYKIKGSYIEEVYFTELSKTEAKNKLLNK